MDEPWIIHCIDMLFLFYGSPHNFIQGRHCLQCQPIQELQNTPALERHPVQAATMLQCIGSNIPEKQKDYAARCGSREAYGSNSAIKDDLDDSIAC